MNIQLDFDRTVVVGPYPAVDRLVPGAIDGIKKIQAAGHKIILNTFRADIGDDVLREAFRVLEENGIVITDFNKNKIKPGIFNLSQIASLARMSQNLGVSNVSIFIDDESQMIPLTKFFSYDIVDWPKVIRQFKSEGLL